MRDGKEEKRYVSFWHKHPIGQSLVVGVVMAIGGYLVSEWKTASEARLVMSTIGYRLEAPLVFPVFGFKVGETGAGYYWMSIANDGNKPLHHVRVGLDNMGKINSIHATGRWTVRTLAGEIIEDMNSFSGQTSLGFIIDSLPPNGRMFVALSCFTNSSKGVPFPSLSSEETLGKITVNDPSLEDIALLQMGSNSQDFKETYRNLRKWEKGADGK